MKNLSALKVDSSKIEAGVWMDLGKYDDRFDGIHVKVRGFGCHDDTKLIDQQARSSRGAAGARLDQDIVRRNINERIVTAPLLLDWRGLSEDDEPIPYSRERAASMLEDRDLRLFRAAIVQACSDVGDGRAAEFEADAGN